MQVLIVGPGRCGTLSLTKWFNELFEKNNIKANAVHEFLAAECYHAYDKFYQTQHEEELQSIALKVCNSDFNVIIGNGYAPILPFIAAIKKNTVLIHLQRRDRDAWIASSVRNANYYPFAYQYYVPDEVLPPSGCIPRTAAFQVGETSREEWNLWSLEKKFGWHYDYVHELINKHSVLFEKSCHIFTEDLKNEEVLRRLAKLVAPQAVNIPSVPKLNAHYFADIESYAPLQRPLAQWLLGNIDWQRVITNPEYFAIYALQQFETLIGWCQTGKIKEIFPHSELNDKNSIQILHQAIPKLSRSVHILKMIKAKHSFQKRNMPFFKLIKPKQKFKAFIKKLLFLR